ncbi:hypothetical protein [Streptomyces shenzhenensis]|uniref:hypothetical protein n=1 Tax=Streptomyces shenzhenensis TaxID=943815 RepID=UPI001F38FB3A|nr:hypothetical protein [Streptomyces shenzhenensis]
MTHREQGAALCAGFVGPGAGSGKGGARSGWGTGPWACVVNDRDSEDWRKPGVDRIIRNATPRGGRGAIVVAFGRVEDVAAGRRARVRPDGGAAERGRRRVS